MNMQDYNMIVNFSDSQLKEEGFISCPKSIVAVREACYLLILKPTSSNFLNLFEKSITYINAYDSTRRLQELREVEIDPNKIDVEEHIKNRAETIVKLSLTYDVFEIDLFHELTSIMGALGFKISDIYEMHRRKVFIKRFKDKNGLAELSFSDDFADRVLRYFNSTKGKNEAPRAFETFYRVVNE